MTTIVDFFPRSLLERHGLPSLPPTKCSSVGETSTNIDWVPDSALFEKRAADLSSAADKRSTELPKSWPVQLNAPLVWSGSELEEDEYTYKLSDTEVHEIEQALSLAKGKLRSKLTR